MSSTLKTTHITEALEHLAQQFVGKANIEALLTLLMNQVQELEGVFSSLVTERTIDSAVGAQLDGFGSIVGEDRLGRTDDEYRVALMIRLLINRCTGTSEEVLAILWLATSGLAPVELTETGNASVRIDLHYNLHGGASEVAFLAGVLSESKPASVSVALVYSMHTDSAAFTFSSDDTEEPSEDQGWASDDQTTGGFWADVEEA